MARYSLLHVRSPLNNTGGTGQYAELTRAFDRSLSFSVNKEGATLSFSMPGRLPQTAAIVPLASDVVVFRDDAVLQRFRVVTRSITKSGGSLKVTFTAVSYKTLLNTRMIFDTDTRSWNTATEQTAIAWTLINTAQSRTYGTLGLSRGVLPGIAVNRTLASSVLDDTRKEYFEVGTKIGDAVEQIADNQNGFEWDCQPPQTAPYTMAFDVWNQGSRNQHSPRSPLLLSSEGTMIEWSHTVTPTDYGNVLRYTGAAATGENTNAALMTAAWYPSSKNPPGTPPEGRYERDINNSDLTTQQAVNDRVAQAYDEIHLYVPEFTCKLARGRWLGPSQLWLGDKIRVVVSEEIERAPGEYLLYIDEDMRVVEISVSIDDLGGEDIALALNRPTYSAKSNRRTINDRLTRLERR